MAGRDNGHPARSYVPLVDLDPQLADCLLDSLREAGVAAYAVPTTGRRSGALVAPRIDRPLHRVYVDAAAVEPARRLAGEQLPRLRAEHAEPTGPTGHPPQPAPVGERRPADDDAWAQIVAAYDEPVADPVRRWPAQEDTPPSNRANGGLAEEHRPQPSRADGGPAEEHFVPPPPPPLPRTDPLTKLGWLGLLGAPVFLVVGVVFGLPLDGWLGLCGIAAFLGGFVLLVLRMQDRPPRDIDPDDGAVV